MDVEGNNLNGIKFLDKRAMIIDFIAGANGGIACVFAGQPFDTVKVKMQVFPSLYKSALHCFRRTWKEERFRGLYAGTGPALVTQIAENSILFLCYGRCQSVIQTLFHVSHVDKLSVFQNACAGSIAAFITSFALCPTELIKCQLQAQYQNQQLQENFGKKPLGALRLTANIITNEGLQGLYRGFVSTCTREVGGYFFFFGGYQLSKRFLTPAGKTADDLGPIEVAISGGIAGACFWSSVFPTDVVKSRIQYC
ncbi:mitochondrial ornithine transporter 2-like isoform X2 [Xenia sp. Carnegie-2017]|uniref:mitochondrial ornithine transporter 2-like isoform X2 n=1 Tax=Xenia sp. Carnegie-2017 TaxID=2897299 RepID=UPI001F0482FA|nr:mitochondrial ornithine transporter 2-like isoform X2 [Xenia sp. Carnegie-2017]